MSNDGRQPVTEHRIRLGDEDPGFICEPDDVLLRAALRSGVNLPYECGSGGCGSCSVQILDGEVEELWPEAPGLSARQRSRGFRLACQLRPRSDCMLKVRRVSAEPVISRPLRQPARLVERTELTADLTEFTFRAAGPADFLAGQFALLRLPGVVGDRAYSMSNLPNAEGLWSFIVKRVPGGQGSAVLFDALGQNHEVQLDGPYGQSYLRVKSPRDVVCIAGGSGLSPVLSILSAAAKIKDDPRRLFLFYGGRRPSDLCVPAALDRDPVLRQRVKCVTAVSDLASSDIWTGERGFIHEVARRHLEAKGHPEANDYYFCGPPAMTDAVQRTLMELNVPLTQAYYDRFM